MCESLEITQDDGVEGFKSLQLVITSSDLLIGSPSELVVIIEDSDRKCGSKHNT